MTIASRYGFEEVSTDSPSVQYARAYFLDLVLHLKRHVVEALFNRAYQPFHELITNNQIEISFSEAVTESDLMEHPNFTSETIVDVTIEKFVSNWKSLQSKEEAACLCGKLREWSNEWNVSDDWCIDNAFITLRNLYLYSLDTNWLDIYDAWHDASNGLRLDSICMNFVPNEEIERRGLLHFNFKFDGLDFSVPGPFYKSTSEFRKEVEDAFRSAGGQNIRSARNALKQKMSEYLSTVKKVMKSQNLQEPAGRPALEEHLEWLVHYQIPPNIQFRRIGAKVKKDESSIREGVMKAAEQLSLTLRSSTTDKHPGRPKGSKNKLPGSGGKKGI